MNRGCEIGMACFLAVALAPLMLIVGALILAIDGRPIIYRSGRAGKNGRQFQLFKFRTMPTDTGGGVTGGPKLIRIGRLGRVLRRTRLDELPQLANILRGDIGFVGPRPPLPEIVAAHPDIYNDVLRTKPGVTGLATLTFHRHEERLLAACMTGTEVARVYAARCIPRKARIDLLIADRRSLYGDFWLIGLTVARLVSTSHGRCRLPRARKTRASSGA